MRLILTLKAKGSDTLTINYFYPLASAIYKLLQFGSPEFSEFLHSVGFVSNSRVYKLFTFALRFNRSTVVGSHLKLLEPEGQLYISSPLIDDFIKNFLIGTFTKKDIEIADYYNRACFSIQYAEYLPEPDFSETVKIKFLSPMTLSTGIMDKEAFKQYYYRPDDNLKEMQRVFNSNLINKYEAVSGKKYEGKGVEFTFDSDYISYAKRKNIRLTKKITILKEHDNPIEVIGMQLPILLNGCTELIKIGYNCGFGEKNSMGFGFGEVETTRH